MVEFNRPRFCPTNARAWRKTAKTYGILAAAVLLTACAEKRVVTALPTPPERLICEKAGARPTLPAEYSIAWDHVAAARTVPEAVARAQSEHAKFIAVIRTREGIVTGYILRLEGVNFVCWTNAEWRRRFEAGVR